MVTGGMTSSGGQTRETVLRNAETARAEGRDSNSRDIHAALDRNWAGRDRDRAAEDRADLLALVRKDEPSIEPPGTDEPRR